ncbi:protein-ER retention protein [Apophysomyces sp. BC1034]|nr:protein-ER retention protein [Apophysomyces sp. BC1034]
MMVDFLLRTTWSLKFSSHVYIRKLEGSVFLIGLLEVFRRWIWVIFRMENEWVRRHQGVLPSHGRHDALRLDRLDRNSSSNEESDADEE